MRQIISEFLRRGLVTITPPIRTHLRSLFLAFALLLGAGQVWGADETVTFSEQGYSNAAEVGTVDGTDCTITFDKGTNSNAPKYYTSGAAIRAYGGNYFTVSSTTKTITKIGLTFGSSDGSNAITTDVDTYNNGTWEGSATSVTFTIGGTSGNRRLASVAVTYEAGGTSTCATPTFNPVSGTTFDESVEVEIASATDGATIYYTTNGDAPTISSDVYSTALTFTETTTLKAIAVKDGSNNSSVATATYTKIVTVPGYAIDFENDLAAYVDWEFTNIKQATSTITAHGGDYYGNTEGKATASLKTKNKVATPGVLTFYTSKESNNTTSCSWTVQVSENGTEWSDVKSFSATTGNKGDWTERSTDLSSYANVYVRISYGSNTAIRAIDDIDLAMASSKAAAGLAYAEADKSKLAKVGAAFTAPTLTNPHNLVAVTYASSDANVAEVNATTGAVTIKAAGKAVITASSAEDDTYKAGSASYTIYVVKHLGTAEDPYDVADARMAIDWNAYITDVYVGGVISNVKSLDPSKYEKAQYYISANGESENELYVYNGYYLNGVAFTANDQLQEGDEVVIKGNLTKYGITYEFAENNQLVSLNRDKQAAGISYATTAYIVKKGATFTEPTLTNPNNLTVTYSSSDENVAAVVDEDTGEIILETGTAGKSVVITATFAGNTSYNAGTAKYAIYVAENAGTAEDPITVADAKGLVDGISTMDNVFVKGIINEVSSFNSTYKSITYWISDNGEAKDLQVYSGKGLSSADFSAKEDLQAGDEVVVCGTLKKYNSDYEFDKNNYLVSLSRKEDAGLAYAETAIAKVIGDDDFTNPLTNPHSLAVTYSSSDENLALVDENTGEVVLGETEGEVTITATFAGNEDYKPATISYTITVNAAAPAPTAIYNKVPSGAYLTSGEYLIVYEDGILAFNGALETLDAAENTVAVTISDDKINGTTAIDAATFTIDVAAGTIKSARGKYIGQPTDANGLKDSDEELVNTLSIDADGNFVVVSAGGAYLRYNATSGQQRFRYFKSTTYSNQKAIQLYRKGDLEFASYTRENLTAGNYGTICLPYAAQAVEGAEIYSIVAKNDRGIMIESVASMQAGVPYIFLATADLLKVTYAAGEAQPAISNNGLVGNIDEDRVDVPVGSYILSNNLLRQVTNFGYGHIGKNRAYIDLAEVPVEGSEPAPAPGARRRSIAIQPSGVTTDLDNLNGEAAGTLKLIRDGQLVIIRDGVRYNAQGQRLQ